MATKKKITKIDGKVNNKTPLSTKEKSDLKAFAQQVAKDHKGSEKPRPLHKIKPEDIVTLCTIPVVKWVWTDKIISKTDTRTLSNFSIKRVVSDCDIRCPAALAKKIRDEFKGNIDSIIEFARASTGHSIFRETGCSTNDYDAMNNVTKDICSIIEKVDVENNYERTRLSAAEMEKLISWFADALRTVRDFKTQLLHYQGVLGKEFAILPDMEKFTIKDGKFVPIEKPEPIKKPSKK